MAANTHQRFDHFTFTQLLRWDKRAAYEYRKSTTGDPIPEDLLTKEEKEANDPASTPTVPAKVEYDAEEEIIKRKLEEAKVAFDKRLGKKKLLALAAEHGITL